MSKAQGPDNSGKLFDNIKRKRKIKNDGELAVLIGEHASVVSEIRNGKREINDRLLIRICDAANITLKAARAQIDERD